MAAAKVQETAASAYETGKQYVQHGTNVAAEKAQQAGAATQDAAARTAEQACLWVKCGSVSAGRGMGSLIMAAMQVRRHGALVFPGCRVPQHWGLWRRRPPPPLNDLLVWLCDLCEYACAIIMGKACKCGSLE